MPENLKTKIQEIANEIDSKQFFVAAYQRYMAVIKVSGDELLHELPQNTRWEDLTLLKKDFSLVLEHGIFITPHIQTTFDLVLIEPDCQISVGRFTHVTDLDGEFIEEFLVLR